MSHSKTLARHVLRLVANEERLGGRLTIAAVAERCGVTNNDVSYAISGSPELATQPDESRVCFHGREQGIGVFYCRLKSAIFREREQKHGRERNQATAE